LVLPLLSGAHGLLEAASVRLETSETPLVAWSTDGLPETPMISPNGERVAYVARRGPKFVVVLDGKPGMEWDGIGQDALLFSRDSQHLYYGGERGSKWTAVADEVAGKEFDGLFRSADLFFDTPTSLHTVAGRWHEFWRVNIKLIEP
jgi:hypothetical protein